MLKLVTKMKIVIINGPNLNLLGSREKEIYGAKTFEKFFEELKQLYPQVLLEYSQSNVEGEIINFIQRNADLSHGIIINPGGYSHTSVAIADAIRSIETPVIEVHVSNIYARESYRHVSLTAQACKGLISGFGLNSYVLALEYFINYQKENQ